jgi:hypothetical protein
MALGAASSRSTAAQGNIARLQQASGAAVSTPLKIIEDVEGARDGTGARCGDSEIVAELKDR